VNVGTMCVDKYESSVWDLHGNAMLLAKVQDGSVTLADLTSAGATLVSPSPGCSPTFPATFDGTGNWTSPLYAVSVAGVHPTACVSWFQANQACRLSRKRLVRNREWQGAAAGTPDPGGADDGVTTCVTTGSGPADAGARSACISTWGAFDMVGNVYEWVADWGDLADSCTTWAPYGAAYGSDISCVSGPGSNFSNRPGAFIRGGNWGNVPATDAGVFAVAAVFDPSASGIAIGFRCAR
jgi:formylglycine-generating enzyme required for sulfatase activity